VPRRSQHACQPPCRFRPHQIQLATAVPDRCWVWAPNALIFIKASHMIGRTAMAIDVGAGGVVKATQAFSRYPAPYSARRCDPIPPVTSSACPWLRQRAPGDTSIRARVKAIRRDLVRAGEPRCGAPAADDLMLGDGTRLRPTNRRCCILGRAIELKLAVSTRPHMLDNVTPP